MEIGVIHTMHPDSPENMFNPVSEFGLTVCQLCCWDTAYATREIAERVVRESKEAMSGYALSGPACLDRSIGTSPKGR